MSDLAFLGTGTMGFPMARNLARAGFSVRAWNRSVARARDLAQDGVRVFDDPHRATDSCSTLITMLSEGGPYSTPRLTPSRHWIGSPPGSR